MPKTISMVPVDSSNIRAIGYDQDIEQLHVQFLNDRHYIYHAVPSWVFDYFMEAKSKGGFFARIIKGVYRGTKQE